MSVIIDDINTIDKDDLKQWKKLKGEKLISVEDSYGNLVLIFEKHKVEFSCQISDEYGKIGRAHV